METSDSKMAALYTALAKAQGEFLPLAKNRSVEIAMTAGGKYKFRYADLEAVLTATRPALAANGLAVIQRIAPVAGSNVNQLITTLVHSDGGHIESVCNLPADNYGNIKNFGSALSYLRRYAYNALVCVAADDDLDEDGQEAGEAGQSDKKAPARAQKPAADQLPAYTDEQFEENMPAWQRAVTGGKTTPDRIIKMVSTKGVLNPQQVKAIHALAQKKGETQE